MNGSKNTDNEREMLEIFNPQQIFARLEARQSTN